ncbi:MAG: phosphatase PAP2 family protein [Planctomycetia bacterium]|nr:phosphatase PAP2 family protein [Planctomycetia bacterium]
MTACSRPSAVAGRRCASALRVAVACALVVMTSSAPGDEPAAADVPGGMFLPAPDGSALWRQTLATISADWPVVRAVEPDFSAVPPRPGLIESAWVEPPGGAQPAWPPKRQRVVVRVVPAVGGVWVDATVQTESLAEPVGGRNAVDPAGGWRPQDRPDSFTVELAARLAPTADPVYSLPPLEAQEMLAPPAADLPWSKSRVPRLSRAGHKIWEDYRNFYDCQSLVCTTAAFGAGALMANTGFDDTMQAAWQRGVEPTSLGTFFSGCKDIGEGRYALSVFGVAAATGLVFEGNPFGDVVGEWGSRSLRMFVVGAPPVYVLQLATGASRPSENDGSKWHFWNDNNGVSGHAFVGAIPFLAAAEMVESPLLKGTLYVCSTFVGFSRMTTDSHYPSQVFLGWYLAWASARAVDATEIHFAGMEVQVVPVPIGDLGGIGITTAW